MNRTFCSRREFLPLALAAAAAAPARASTQPSDETTRLRAFAEEFVAAYDAGPKEPERLLRLVAPEIDFEDPTFRLKHVGKESFARMLTEASASIISVQMIVHSQLVHPPSIALQVTLRLVARPRAGQPPIEPLNVRGATFLDIRDNLIQRWRDYYDFRTYAEKMHLRVCREPSEREKDQPRDPGT